MKRIGGNDGRPCRSGVFGCGDYGGKLRARGAVSVIGETMVIGGADGAHFNLYCCQGKP